LTNHFIHVDFKRLTKDSVVIAEVPMRPLGTAEGVQLGGVLQTPMHTITLKGKPADIPECLAPDISHLEVGQSILLEELQLPKGVVAIGRGRTKVVGVATSRMMAKAEEEGVGEATTAEGAKDKAEADAAAGEEKK
ncbi:MAG: hypothetical protein HOD74_10265, partial [Verrucomicrobia bacterium]|nr:hypothetical protein [Verrucomicrobiota bacterium]